jgi:hypothetical protein
VDLIDEDTKYFDWWLSGAKAHMGLVLTQQAYYYMRADIKEAARSYANIAKELTQFESSHEVIDETLKVAEQRAKVGGSYLNYKPLGGKEWLKNSKEASNRGDIQEAIYWAERAIIWNTADQKARRWLIELYSRSGDEEWKEYHMARLDEFLGADEVVGFEVE